MFGSLNDFIDIPRFNQQYKTIGQTYENDQLQSPLIKYSRKNVLQIKKRRTMSGVENYKASDKSLLFQKFTKNFPQLQKTKRQFSAQKQQNPINSRKPISQSKLSSLFYGQNPIRINESIGKDEYGGLFYKMSDQITKSQLKREHNLLRAIVRTKLNEQQKITNTHYQDSFNRMSLALQNIKAKPIPQNQIVQIEEQPKTNRSIILPISKRAKSRLSNKKRLEFQNCLNWTKKRNKNGSFYAEKLGKNDQKVKIDNNKNAQHRKSILQSLHSRSFSLDVNTRF